jgi:ERCC4-type nuclease
MQILVDTREKQPIFLPGESVTACKLIVGDYTTTNLQGKVHIERKSPQDLYSSIISNHKRFCRELLRAKENNINLYVFVECEKQIFLEKQFRGGYRLKCPTSVLNKILNTMMNKYDMKFVWCNNRNKMKLIMLMLLEEQTHNKQQW